MKFFWVFCLLLSSCFAKSQGNDGDNLTSNSYPVAGNWYNPEQPGSGYIIDVQKGYIFGFYFGYDGEGQQRWMSFQGNLQKSDKIDVNWELDSPLTNYQGGNAFNEEYRVPTAINSGHTIHFEFDYAQSGRFAVDGGDYQKIEPLNYRVETNNLFDHIDYPYPDLRGVWYYEKESSSPDIKGGKPFIVDVNLLTNSFPPVINHWQDGREFYDQFGQYDHFYPFEGYSGRNTIKCNNNKDIDNSIDEITCEYFFGPGNVNDYQELDFNNIGAFYFESDYIIPFTDELSITKIKAKRLNYLRMNADYSAVKLHDDSKLLPVTGNWYNLSEPGTGYIIDVQRGYVFGMYFGYDENGQQRWMTFQGELQKSEDPDVRWELSSVLSNYQGGNSFNSDYQAPISEASEHSIHFEFLYTHGGRFSVDDGEYQTIKPLNYRVETERLFEEVNYDFPDLTGQWVFNYYRNHPEISTQEFNYYNDLLMIGNKQIIHTNDITTLTYDVSVFTYWPNFDTELILIGQIKCTNDVNTGGQNPVNCLLSGFPNFAFRLLHVFDGKPWLVGYEDDTMKIPLKDMGAFQFNAEFIRAGDDEQGFKIDARRANFINFYTNQQ